MENKISRGNIYYATLENEKITGSEQRGRRPIVIVQNNIGNEHSPTTIIVPITSKIEAKSKIPTHIPLKNYRYRMIKDSMILAEQITTIDKTRLGEFIGKLDEEELKLMEKAISVALNIEKDNSKGEIKELVTRNQIASYAIIAREYLRHCGNLEISNREFGEYIISLMDLYSPLEIEGKAKNK